MQSGGSPYRHIYNEPYKKKLNTYANTLYWNEILRKDTYKSILDFNNMMNKFKLNFRHMDKFRSEELKEQHRLLYNVAKIIWN